MHLEDEILVKVLRDDAVPPFRKNAEDIGMDITPTHVFKKVTNDTWLLGTGLAMKPPKGYYLDMLGRSSISKSPVMVANAVGVMDPIYTGEYLIAVTPKLGVDLESFDPKSLITGKPLAQIVVREAIYAKIKIVKDLEETSRGDGNFGHTDNL
jgi:dUTP pyrophosphatase